MQIAGPVQLSAFAGNHLAARNSTARLTLSRISQGLTKRSRPGCRISPSRESGMEYSREVFETLRLLRAFGKIQDPQKRREILELVENEAAAPKDDSDDEPRSR